MTIQKLINRLIDVRDWNSGPSAEVTLNGSTIDDVTWDGGCVRITTVEDALEMERAAATGGSPPKRKRGRPRKSDSLLQRD